MRTATKRNTLPQQLSEAKRRIAILEAQLANSTPEGQTEAIQRLQQENERLTREIESLQPPEPDLVKAQFTYELAPITEDNVCSRYDGLDDGIFIFHEALSFRDMNGYDSSQLGRWAMDSVGRAFGIDGAGNPLIGDLANRCGDAPETWVKENGVDRRIPAVPCSNLPPFDKKLRLEVIVQVLPRED